MSLLEETTKNEILSATSPEDCWRKKCQVEGIKFVHETIRKLYSVTHKQTADDVAQSSGFQFKQPESDPSSEFNSAKPDSFIRPVPIPNSTNIKLADPGWAG